jgi:nucleotide-binding universal stress UspA family protein
MIRMKTVLVATDFGLASEAALNYGRELARTFGAMLQVIHVTENIIGRYAFDGSVLVAGELQTEVEKAARERLEGLVTAEDRRELHAKAVLRTSSATAETIVDYAHESHADAIVVGTHGRRAMAHLLLGSVAERVVRLAPCPVLTVRHPEHDFILPDALVAVARA